MTVSPGSTDPRPLQVRVTDDIRMKIESGEYEPGEQLPTLDALGEAYGCSLAVIRKALDLLRQQGLVVTRQGKGSFVRERPVMVRHGMERYARSRWKDTTSTGIVGVEAQEQGKKSIRIVRQLAEVPAPARVAERLGIEPDTTVWTRQRTVALEGRPSQLADSFYPLDVARGTALTETETGPGGDFARLDDAGHTPSRIREEWHVRMPTVEESTTLRLPAGTPVVDFIRTIFDQDDRPVEVMLSVLAGDMTSFRYEFPVPE